MGLALHAMSDDHNFQFFIKGVKPMWEDRMCKMGGKISFIGSCEQVSSPHCCKSDMGPELTVSSTRSSSKPS
jgi:hypothetical protein